jgi:hypothetical protein
VIFVCQRKVKRVRTTVTNTTLPEITLGQEKYLVDIQVKPVEEARPVEVAIKEQRSVESFVQNKGQAALQALPCEVRSLTFQALTKLSRIPKHHRYVPSDCFALQLKLENSLLTLDNLIQVHQNIAAFFENDSDVIAYAQLCKNTRDSISSSVWRKRFAQTFDMPEGDFKTLALAKKYAYRRDVAGWICFDLKQYGAISRECRAIQEANTKKCLLVIRELILGESD